MFDPLAFRFKISPGKLISNITININGTNKFGQYATDSFSFSVTISAVYVLTLIAQYIGPVVAAIGFFKYRK